MASLTERLRAAPSFALGFTLDGRPYVAKETEPYVQYWLSERYRVLLSMFSGRGGATIEQAIAGYARLMRAGKRGEERKRLLRAIADMRAAGVLIGTRDDVSRYDARIVAAYLTHRPFPRQLSDRIIADAPIGRSTRVLDLAGGPGDLAVALAAASDHVSLMELSRGFLAAARRRARRFERSLTAIHDSCNRLMFRDDAFDVVTVSQALHWLDDVLICRGLCRLLTPGGSFFVIHGAFDVGDDHPLGFLFGRQSILGSKPPGSFATEVEAVLRRLTLLFEALNAAHAQRIVPVGVALYRQRRPIDLGFARAFLTPQHIAVTGQQPAAFWRDVEERCAGVPDERLLGTYHWAILHFRRGGDRLRRFDQESHPVSEIGFAPGTP